MSDKIMCWFNLWYTIDEPTKEERETEFGTRSITVPAENIFKRFFDAEDLDEWITMNLTVCKTITIKKVEVKEI